LPARRHPLNLSEQALRNIFDRYSQPENRVTHALMTAIDEDRSLPRSFLRELVKVHLSSDRLWRCYTGEARAAAQASRSVRDEPRSVAACPRAESRHAWSMLELSLRPTAFDDSPRANDFVMIWTSEEFSANRDG